MTQPQSPPQASLMEQTQESQDSNKPEQPTQKSVPRTPRHDIDIDYLEKYSKTFEDQCLTHNNSNEKTDSCIPQ